jgi:hypothetical protein
MAGKRETGPDMFFADSHFQKMARRPGGATREEALKDAEVVIDKIKSDFSHWLEREIDALTAEIQRGRSATSSEVSWAENAVAHSRHIRDVGTTMGFELVTFITNNLCKIFETIIAGATPQNEIIDCHIDALLLARQEQYRHLRPEQLPELNSGLRRVLEVANNLPNGTLK